MFHSAVKSKYLGSFSAVAAAISPVVLQAKAGDSGGCGGGASAPQDKTLPGFSSHLHGNNSTAFNRVALSAPSRVC